MPSDDSHRVLRLLDLLVTCRLLESFIRQDLTLLLQFLAMAFRLAQGNDPFCEDVLCLASLTWGSAGLLTEWYDGAIC